MKRMLKRLRNKISNLALMSLILSVVFLLILLAVIDANFAGYALAAVLVVIGIIDRVRPEWVDSIVLKWGSVDNVVHWALLVIEVAVTVYLIFFFTRNYEFQIVPKTPDKTKPT